MPTCIASASMCSISTVSTSQPLANSRTASGSRKEPNCRAQGEQQGGHVAAVGGSKDGIMDLGASTAVQQKVFCHAGHTSGQSPSYPAQLHCCKAVQGK